MVTVRSVVFGYERQYVISIYSRDFAQGLQLVKSVAEIE
jgi:hypothetical protein